MEQDAALANITTFGVEDLACERAFYDALGWPIVFEADDFVVFELGGALFALFPLDKLAADSCAEPEPRRGGIRSSIIVTVEAPGYVDDLARRAERAGGTVTKQPTDAKFFTGRDAYFSRPRRQLLGDRVLAERQSRQRRGPARREPTGVGHLRRAPDRQCGRRQGRLFLSIALALRWMRSNSSFVRLPRSRSRSDLRSALIA
jgi:predicted lactoylglutathione lyase